MFDEQDIEFDYNKLRSLDSIIVNRKPNLDNELSNEKYVVESIGEGTIVKFIQTLENYLKVSVGYDTKYLTKYDKIQLIDVTEVRYPNKGDSLLAKRRIKNLKKNNGANLGNFLKSTKTNSPTGDSGASTLPPIGNNCMYIETSSNNQGNIVFVSYERTDIIQITNIKFYYNRFSILSSYSLKTMGRFRKQLLLSDNTRSTRHKIHKNDRHSDTSAQWHLISLKFTEKIFGVKLVYDLIDTFHADMCFSKNAATHSVY